MTATCLRSKIFIIISLLTLVLLTVNTSEMNAQEADGTGLVHSVYLPVVLNSTDSAIDEIAGIELHDEEILNSETLIDITPAFTAGTTGFLKAQGQQIVDGTGRSVKWRGVNIDAYYYFDESTWPDAQLNWYANQRDIQYLDKLGVTAIRLVLHWKYFNSDLGYRLIDQYLTWCKAAGIYLILDMHVVPPDDVFGQEQIWNNPDAQQQFVDLWRTVAQHYQNETTIAGYDLYNEPRPQNPHEWWALANRVADAIRTVDINHILIVETPTWPQINFALIDDVNVVYSYHDYEPFIVTHAGVAWGLDSPVPSDYPYPGKVLTDLEWVGYAADARNYSAQSTDWIYWDSGQLTPMANGQPKKKVEWATLKPYATHTIGSVWFDDLEVYKRGVGQPVANAGAEESSLVDENRPRSWYFYSPQDSDFAGAWSSEIVHTGNRSLQITGHANFGVWRQNNEYFTAPLFRVTPGDTFQLKGWLYAPDNNGGSAGLSLDYFTGIYKAYNYNRLLAYIQPTLAWAATNNVPLYVGEFGAMPNSPGKSRDNVLRDKIKLMNASGVHWSLWTFRTPRNEDPSFGLYTGDSVDKSLARILKQGLRQ